MVSASDSLSVRTAALWAATPRLLRFFVVGGVNTVFGYGVYALLLFVGFHYAAAAFIGTVAGVVFNYFTTGRFVFDHLSGAGLSRFVGVYAAVYCLKVACLAVLARFGVGPYVAGLLLLVPMALVSYVLLGRFVFGGAGAAR